MDLLNRAYAQLNDLFRSMTPGSRVTAGLLLVVVVISMSYLFTHQTASPSVDLMPGVSITSHEMSTMRAAFAKANLNTFEVRGESILVPRGAEAAYMVALVEAKALPPNFGTALRDAINSDTMFTDGQKRAQTMKAALEEMLALCIRRKVGAEDVSVCYDTEIKPGLRREKEITALVSIKPAGNSQLDEAQVLNIRCYVGGGAIAGLRPENVTVADLSPNGRTYSGKLESNPSAGDKLYSFKRTYENDLKREILAALRYIPNVTVGVNIELQRVRTSPPPSRNRRIASASRHDAAANTPQTTQDLAAAPRPDTAQQSNVAAVLGAVLGDNAHRNNVPTAGADLPADMATDSTDQDGGSAALKQVKASVGIPVSYLRKIWHDGAASSGDSPSPSPDPQELDRIREAESARIQKQVAQLLPSVENGGDPTQMVAVTMFPDPTVSSPAHPAWQQAVLAWLEQHGGMAALVALAVMSVGVLWSMVRGAAAEMQVTSVFTATAAAMDNSDSADSAGSSLPKRPKPRTALRNTANRDELSEIVRQDPNAAANILRTWVGNSG